MFRRKVLAVNRTVAAILLMFPAAVSQERSPNVLLHAAQCLAAKDFLAPSTAAALSFGYLLDVKSYPGEKLVYVVRYTGSDRSHGEAFTVFVTERQGQQVFNIQNNATFVRTKGGVEFARNGDPLGGIWTQQHLVSAIKQIELQSSFRIPVRKLRAPPLIRCEAYTDNWR